VNKYQSQAVAVIVPSWNSLALLPRCLGSLSNQGAEVELLVVDNGSSDGSLEYLERGGVPHLSLPRNIGFAAAVNLGVRRTISPSALVLNADTMLEPGCIGILLDALRADPSLAGVQPRIVQLETAAELGTGDPFSSVDSAPLYSAGQALSADGRALEQGAGQAQSSRWMVRREVFGVCGAACLLRRDLFSQLGGYDESYFAFYEDVDLNVRSRIAGRRFEYIPEAAVWHVGNASWQAGFRHPAAENARLVARNRLATQIKFMPLTSLPRITAVEVGSLLRAARERRFLPTLRGKLSALAWLPHLLHERRRLRSSGDLRKARRWLGCVEWRGTSD